MRSELCSPLQDASQEQQDYHKKDADKERNRLQPCRKSKHSPLHCPHQYGRAHPSPQQHISLAKAMKTGYGQRGRPTNSTTHEVFESVADVLAGLAAFHDDGGLGILVHLRLSLALRAQYLGLWLLRIHVLGRHRLVLCYCCSCRCLQSTCGSRAHRAIFQYFRIGFHVMSTRF